jgi:hypothetical protein
MIIGNCFFTVRNARRPCDHESMLGYRVSCIDLSDREKFPPVVSRTAIDSCRIPESDVVSWVAKKYRCSRLVSSSGLFGFHSSIDVEIAEGVTLGFGFFKPDRTPDDQDQRHINIQFLIKESESKSDALRALKAFLRHLESAPQNTVEVVFFKYGPIDAGLVGRPVVTAGKDRLEKAYKRLLRPHKIPDTDYYQIEFTPKFPKCAETVIKQGAEL